MIFDMEKEKKLIKIRIIADWIGQGVSDNLSFPWVWVCFLPEKVREEKYLQDAEKYSQFDEDKEP